jgi:hypothetical protein
MNQRKPAKHAISEALKRGMEAETNNPARSGGLLDLIPDRTPGGRKPTPRTKPHYISHALRKLQNGGR